MRPFHPAWSITATTLALGLIACHGDNDRAPPVPRIATLPLDVSTLDGPQCWDLLQDAADQYWDQLLADLLPDQPTCHIEPPPPPPPTPSPDPEYGQVDTTAAIKEARRRTVAAVTAGLVAEYGGDPDYDIDPDTEAAGDEADTPEPGPVVSCDYTEEQLARDAAARIAMADFDAAFEDWLAAQTSITIDGATYTGSDLMTCESTIDAVPTEPPENGLCTVDATTTRARPADVPGCAPEEKINCMAVVWPKVNSYAHHPNKESDMQTNGCTSDWQKMFREWWTWRPNVANGAWGGATGVNAYGGYPTRHSPWSFASVASCSQQTDSLSAGQRLEFLPQAWFVPKKIYNRDKAAWELNEKHQEIFFGPDGKKYGPTCTGSGLPYDKLFVKARYAPKLKEVYSGRAVMDDDGRVTAGIATNDHRAEIQGSLTCRAPNTAITNPDTFSVVQGSVEVPFHAVIEPNCTTETSAGIDVHGQYQSNNQGGVSVGLSAGTKEGCKKNSGTAISMAVSCDLIGSADLIRAYTSEVDMKMYTDQCITANRCQALSFLHGKNDPMPWLNVAWEVTNLYAWARSSGTGCDFLNKRSCVAWAYFKTGSVDIKEDGAKQNKDNTMLWEGNRCEVMRRTSGTEASVPQIPCYWVGQSGDTPAPVKYRFDPKNYKWDPDKPPQP